MPPGDEAIASSAGIMSYYAAVISYFLHQLPVYFRNMLLVKHQQRRITWLVCWVLSSGFSVLLPGE